ncbi:MAG TPA: putative quinol monooxygenase [Bryobacteraceae bacterium]|nr:putative quinol monooxygenase [Bryobacteraceae bacterium]
MLIAHIHVRVRPDAVEAFRAATIENARNSVQEPGVLRFECIQQSDDPTQFVLVEIYRAPESVTEHRATAHYSRWRDTVADMMAEPRSRVEYKAVFPESH